MANNRCNKAALITVKILFFISKLMGLAPVCFYPSVRKFHTHRVSSIYSLIVFVVLAVTGPFLVRQSANLYAITSSGGDYDKLTLATLIGDIALSTLLVGLLFLKRHKMAELLNILLDLLHQLHSYTPNIVDGRTLLTVWLKLGLTMYGIATCLPFLIIYGHKIEVVDMALYLITLFVHQISSIFTVNMMVVILLLSSLARCLEQAIQRTRSTNHLIDDSNIAHLISIESSLHQVVPFFVNTFQVAIFLQIFHNFLTWLANLFALLDVIVHVNHFQTNDFIYTLTVFVNMYSLIYVAQYCADSAQRVNWAFLEMEQDLFECEAPNELLRLQQVVPLQMDFPILGLFSLKNNLILFLLSFSLNFFVVILEFEVNKYVNIYRYTTNISEENKTAAVL